MPGYDTSVDKGIMIRIITK